MTGVAIILALGLLILWVGTVAGTAWMLTHPPRRTYASAVARNKPGDPSELDVPRRFESWSFVSRGLPLPVWEIAGDDPQGPTVIMTHGWGDSRIGALARLGALAPAASRIIAWDLPGHGDAPGACTLGLVEAVDLLALIEFRRPDGPLVLYGWSLGAGVSLVAAERAGAMAVVAESPYRLAATPARQVLMARGLPHRASLLPALALIRAWYRGAQTAQESPDRTPFDRAAHASRLTCPLMVLHGVDDDICPIEDGRAIAAAAAQGQLAGIEGGHHNDLWTDPALAARCAESVRSFIRSLTPHGPLGS